MFSVAKRPPILLILLLATIWAQTVVQGADSTAARQEVTDEDFAHQGEYVGEIEGDSPRRQRVGVQVVAMGKGRFLAVGYPGGLPGDGWRGGEVVMAESIREGNRIAFRSDEVEGVVVDGAVLEVYLHREKVGTLRKTHRQSPTLGKEPPQGARVLFDGSSGEEFPGAHVTPDALLVQGATSRRTFRDILLHLEFRLPYMPLARGQERGNSGCYLQGRYEVQMLDSFGLKGEDNECGGLYGVKPPRVNMCLPPLSWQTYDIEFRAARFNPSGVKTANARLTVHHNGVLIHDAVEVPRATTAAILGEGPEPGPLHLQDHGCAVRYRNIWIVEL